MRARRHESLRRWVVLLLAAVCSALVGVLSQSPAAAPVASAAPAIPAGSGPVEVESLRTQKSATFRQRNGSMTTRVSAAPLHFRDSGDWVTIDNDLEEQPDGTVATAATGYDLQLPEDLSEPVQVAKDGSGVAFELEGAAVGERTVDGSTATFEDARPGVDVEYTAGADLVKEELVLAGPDSERSFSFAIDPNNGATPRLADDGAVELVEPDGSVDARIAPPVMADAAGANSHDLEYVLEETADGWRLGLDADTPWLRSADREWPVRVDPTVYFGVNINALIKDPKTGPDTPFGQYQPYLQVTSEGDTRRRSLVRFTDLTAIPKSAVVTAANANFYNDGVGDAGLSVQAMQLTRGFTEAGANWGTSNGSTAWTSAGGDFAARPLDTQTVDANTTGWNRFWIGNAVQDWVNKPAENHGLLLKLANESTPGNTKSSEWRSVWGGGNYPYMEITWEHATGQKPNWTFDTIGLSDRSQLKVNVANGNLIYEANDVSVAGVGGMGLGITRTWNSQSEWWNQGAGWNIEVGDGTWTSSYNNGETRVIRASGMTQWRFKKTSSGWKSPAALNATLTDVSGGVKLEFHKSGEVWFFANADEGGLSYRENRNGHRITYNHTGSSGNRWVSSITDTQGRTFAISRNAQHYVTQIGDAAYPGGARTWNYGFSDYVSGGSTIINVRQSTYTDPEGKVTSYEYGSGLDLERITDARGNRIKITWDYSGPGGVSRVASIQRMTNTDWNNPVGPKTTYSYDTANDKTTIVAPNGNAAGATPSQHQTVYKYDPITLQVKKVTNAKGYDSDTEYSPNGDANRFTSQAQTGDSGTAPVQAINKRTYDDENAMPSDPTNNLRGGEAPSGEKFSIDYYGAADFPSSNTGRYRAKQSDDGNGGKRFFSYDTAGNVTKVGDAATSPANKADLEYTDATANPNLPKGLVKKATDGNANATTYDYYVNGHANYQQGNLKTVKPPLVGTKNPGDLAFEYDTEGRVTKATDTKTQVTTYTYDKLDRTKTVTVGTKTYTYTYDNNGNLTGRTESGVSPNNASFVYDNLNRRTSETVAGASKSYTYDDNSNLKTLTDGWGTTSYAYDVINRATSVTDPTSTTTTPRVITYEYIDTENPRKQIIKFPAATGGTGNGATITTETDLSGKVKVIDAKTSTGAALRKLDYSYLNSTSAGTPPSGLAGTERTYYASATVGKTQTYTYDALTRLSTWTDGTNQESYTFDRASNRKSKTYKPTATTTATTYYGTDAGNALCWTSTTAPATTGDNQNTCAVKPGTGSTTYSNDDNGNLTTGGHTYDTFDRQSAVGSNTFAYLGPDNTELVTDGPATLTRSIIGLNSLTASSATTYYLRDPTGRVLGERTSSGTRYFVPDRLGSTRWILNGNSIDRTYTYTPDGNAPPTVSTNDNTGTGANTRIRWASGYQTSAGGLYHFNARYYDPSLARWNQRDPLDQNGDPREANAYLYAGADPVNRQDPSGLRGLKAGVGAGPFSAGVSRNTTGSNQRTQGGLSAGYGRASGGKKNSFGLSASATAYTGEDDDGPSVGAKACFIGCVGADSDTGFEFGFGFGADVSINT